MPVMRGMGQIGQRMRHAVRAQFPGLYDGMRTAVWQFGSLDRVVSYRLAREARVPTATLVDELRREGIVVRDVGEIFIPGDPLFTAVNDYGHDMWREVSGRQGREGEQALEAFLTNKRKEFRVHLLPEELPYDHPIVRLALDDRLLALVNRYMGMRAYLRAVDLWWDRATDAPPKETQLWHRDQDDLRNMKVFLYLNDVDVDTGPFCFIPRTHPRGARRHVYLPDRTTDEQMQGVFPATEWKVCTGRAGTIILCDTCGFHKGLKPKRGNRLMVVLQYTSGAAHNARAFKLHGRPEGALSSAQTWALQVRPGQLPVSRA